MIGFLSAAIQAGQSERQMTASLTDSLCAPRSGSGTGLAAQLLGGGQAAGESMLGAALQRCGVGVTTAQAVARAVLDDLLGRQTYVTGAEALAAVLAAHQVTHVFAYAGTSELGPCDAVDRLPDISLINARGDKESVFMAAGASLLRPNRGAAIVHGARGITNAAGALADVRRSEIATVVIVGLPSTRSAPFLPPHGEQGLLDAMANFAGWVWQAPPVPADCSAGDLAASRFVQRVHEALSVSAEPPFQPSLFGLPQDVAEKRWVPLAALAKYEPLVRYRPLTYSFLDSAANALLAARRPVLLVDDYALRYEGAREALNRICSCTGAAVLQVRYRRGPMLFERLQRAEVSHFVGWLNQFSESHRQLLRDCDLLVTVEDRNMYERVVGELPACRKIAITSDPLKVAKNGYLGPEDILAQGDPGQFLFALSERLVDGGAGRPAWFPAVVREEAMMTPESPSRRVSEGRRVLAQVFARHLATWRRPVLVDDSQMFGGLLSEWYEDLPAGLRVFGGHGGFVGGGLASAVGLAVANPDVRVMCTLGDQGFTNAIQGLVAAVQERVRIIFVICNNGESVSLRKQANATFGEAPRPYLSNVPGLDYCELVEGMGIRAARVSVPLGDDLAGLEGVLDAVGAALRQLDEVDGPSVLELRLPADPEVWRGIWATEGFEQATFTAAEVH
jgi:acetolactate synthase-1/2/3 large subunit